MNRRLDAGALLVAASATLLVVAEFLDWFGLPGRGAISAWTAFEVLDLVLLGAAVAAVAAAFGLLSTRVLLAAAGLALAVVASQLIQPPPAAQGTDREVGAWLALAAALALAAGAALVAAQIAVIVDVRGRERRPRVPAVDRRDAAGDAPDPAADAGRSEPAASGAQEDSWRSGAAPTTGGSVAADPQATQAFEAPTETSEPQ